MRKDWVNKQSEMQNDIQKNSWADGGGFSDVSLLRFAD
jgi:hypothetical protein